MSLWESKRIYYNWQDSKLWILVESLESHNIQTHTRRHKVHTHCPVLCLVIQPNLCSYTAENHIFFKGFAKWNAGPEPQQVDSRSAQETALGSGVKWKCLEVHHKTVQQHSLPFQEKCKLQLSRSGQFMCGALWRPVAPIKGNSQSVPDVRCAPFLLESQIHRISNTDLTERNTSN